jgi:hypothetical protein
MAGATTLTWGMDPAITHGGHYLVANSGTHNLGNDAFARRLWRAAATTRPRARTGQHAHDA